MRVSTAASAFIFATLCGLLALLGGVGANPSPIPTNKSIYNDRKRWRWCGPGHETGALVGLDDLLCQKVFPPLFDREFICPTLYDRDSRFSPPSKNISDIRVDEKEMASVVSPDVSIAVGIVKRHSDGSYTIRYIGKNASTQPVETWSSSKVFAASHAAYKLRSISDDKIGLDAFELGHDEPERLLRNISLGDLMTIVTSYDINHNLSSNEIGGYYHAIGGHKNATGYIHERLGAPADETFGGDYGEEVPAFLGYTFVDVKSNASIDPDKVPRPPISNTMSPLTMAEYLRRIVFSREDGHLGSYGSADFRWEDSQAILYGARESQLFPFLQFGGMAMSSDVYLQLGLGDMDKLNNRSHGRWRLFSKLGFGFSDIRKRYEIVLNGYACMPSLQGEKSMPILNEGLEFVISVKAFDYSKDHGVAVDRKMQAAFKNVTRYLRKVVGGE